MSSEYAGCSIHNVHVIKKKETLKIKYVQKKSIKRPPQIKRGKKSPATT